MYIIHNEAKLSYSLFNNVIMILYTVQKTDFKGMQCNVYNQDPTPGTWP